MSLRVASSKSLIEKSVCVKHSSAWKQLQFPSCNLAKETFCFAFCRCTLCKQAASPLLLILVFSPFYLPWRSFHTKLPHCAICLQRPNNYNLLQRPIKRIYWRQVWIVSSKSFPRQVLGRPFRLWYVTSAVLDYWEDFKKAANLHKFIAFRGITLTACVLIMEFELCRSTVLWLPLLTTTQSFWNSPSLGENVFFFFFVAQLKPTFFFQNTS